MADFHQLDKNQVADKAKAMIGDPIITEIFRRLEDKATAAWRNTQPGDQAGREAAFASIKAVEDFRAQLHSLAIGPRVDATNQRAKLRAQTDTPAALDKALRPEPK